MIENIFENTFFLYKKSSIQYNILILHENQYIYKTLNRSVLITLSDRTRN